MSSFASKRRMMQLWLSAANRKQASFWFQHAPGTPKVWGWHGSWSGASTAFNRCELWWWQFKTSPSQTKRHFWCSRLPGPCFEIFEKGFLIDIPIPHYANISDWKIMVWFKGPTAWELPWQRSAAVVATKTVILVGAVFGNRMEIMG